MKERKTSTSILLIIMAVLIVAEIIVKVWGIFSDPDSNKVYFIFILITLVLTALYGLLLYKKPHGNMLKYTMLIAALMIIYNGVEAIKATQNYSFLYIIYIIAGTAICYSAGRLNRIEQNRILFPIIAVALLVTPVYATINFLGSSSFINIFSLYSLVVVWLTLMIAYFVRHKEHKEAGLVDPAKEK